MNNRTCRTVITDYYSNFEHRLSQVPKTLEIILLEHKEDEENTVQFPGIFLFSGPARMMRPVKNISLNQIELIGSFEQVYLNVALQSDPIIPGVRLIMQ